ncbi:MAG: transglutaminase-like domain-containing protein [Gemmataceae bacterium]
MPRFTPVAVALLLAASAPAADKWWSADVEKQLAAAKGNRGELEKALLATPKEQQPGMEFLLKHMPERDLTTLKADYLTENVSLAYKSRAAVPWGKDIPDAVFFNNVLPYANLDETRDPWRKELTDLCLPMVKECKTPAEAAQLLNRELFPKLKVKYSTQRKAPNAGPKQTMETGLASCTGLSILLSDACRSVCVPTRVVGTPLWANKRGNHTWLEIWDKDWHFTGACEPDQAGLDRGWFVGDAAQAKKDVPEHAIYAASFAKTDTHFPLVWARNSKGVHAENVTDRYAKPAAKTDTVRVLIRVTDANKKRVAADVMVTDGKKELAGKSKGESADTNDFLTFDLKPDTEYTVTVSGVTKAFKSDAAGKTQTVQVELK